MGTKRIVFSLTIISLLISSISCSRDEILPPDESPSVSPTTIIKPTWPQTDSPVSVGSPPTKPAASPTLTPTPTMPPGTDHDYFQGKWGLYYPLRFSVQQFGGGVGGGKFSIKAKYISSKTSSINAFSGTTVSHYFDFEGSEIEILYDDPRYNHKLELEPGTEIEIRFNTPSYVERLELEPGTEYEIYYSSKDYWGGSNPNYLLIICREGKTIFVAQLGPIHYNSFEDELAVSNPPMMWQTVTLTDHYFQLADEWDTKLTNVEMTFTIGGDSISLHQGETQILGDYEIVLGLAVEFKYLKYGVKYIDSSDPELSYTMTLIK